MTTNSFNIPRNWWGKIIGGLIGLFRGGLTGIVFGIFLGHMVDRFLSGITGVGTTRKSFFEALFSSLGHLSKADGKVTDTEIRMVESLMQRMDITGEERQRAIRFFNQGKQSDFDLELALQSFVKYSVVRQDLRLMFMEIIVEAAYSSGTVSQQEHAVLLRIARALRIPGQLFAAMMQARGAPAGAYGQGSYSQSRSYRASSGNTSRTLDQAYAQLGLTRNASRKAAIASSPSAFASMLSSSRAFPRFWAANPVRSSSGPSRRRLFSNTSRKSGRASRWRPAVS